MLKKRHKKYLENFILLSSIGILSYSFIIDFILRKYDDLSIISFLINFQEKIYWITIFIIFLCVISFFTKNIKLVRLNKKILILIVILLIISSIRLWRLDMMPLNLDEANSFFLSAKNIKDNGFFKELKYFKYYAHIPINDNSDRAPVLFVLLVFLNSYIFKNPLFCVRIVSALMGVLTVLLTFFLIKDLYDLKTGFFSAIFLALLPWHVIQSRTGLDWVLVPLFGLLIFYVFNKVLRRKDNKFLFLTALFLVIGGFYTYTISRIFWIIIIVLIIKYYKRLAKFGAKNIIISILIILLFSYPHLALFYNSDYPFGERMRGYVEFSIDNYISNLKSEFKILFIDTGNSGLYISSLKGPLLSISLAILFFFAFSHFLIFRRDPILFIWIIIPILCVPLIKYIGARFLIVLLPFVLIFVSKFLNDIAKLSYVNSKKKKIACKRIIFPIVILMICFIFLNLIFSLMIYFQTAPKDLEENKIWSYGVEQSINFLFEEKIKDNKFVIFEDFRMTSRAYVWYYQSLKGKNYPINTIKGQVIHEFNRYDENRTTDIEEIYQNKGFTIYYLIWNPLSHKDCWEGKFYEGFELFSKIHPNVEPVKIINYPTGEPALNIYENKKGGNLIFKKSHKF